MRLQKKSALLLAALCLVSIFLTLYTIVAYRVSEHVYYAEGVAVWSSAPSGSFFPWPRAPGMLQVLSGMNEVDSFIYIGLIKSWVLMIVIILSWVGTFLGIINLVRRVSSRVISAIVGISGGLFFTLLSGLYAVTNYVVDAEMTHFGFPLAWFEASSKGLLVIGPLAYYFLWQGFVVDFIVYGLLVSIAIYLYFTTVWAWLREVCSQKRIAS